MRRIFVLLLALPAATASAAGFSVLDGASLEQWSEITFDNAKPTKFEAVVDEDSQKQVLAIRADGSSSGWNYEHEISLAKTPYIKVRWKAEQIGERAGDPSTKLGDDYPLRIYLHKAGFMKSTLRSVQLVLSPVHQSGEHWESPYSGMLWSIMTYAFEGNDRLKMGEWSEITLDMREVWKISRGEDPPEILDGISVLGDTDGGKSVSVVYLENIWFLESIE